MNLLVAAILLAEVLEWDAVTEYVDGTVIKEGQLSHYEVKDRGTPVATVAAPLTEVDLGVLAKGTYSWTVSVVDKSGLRSGESTPLPYVVAQVVVTPVPTATIKPTITPYIPKTPTPLPTPVRPVGVPTDWELKGIEYRWGPK